MSILEVLQREDLVTDAEPTSLTEKGRAWLRGLLDVSGEGSTAPVIPTEELFPAIFAQAEEL